MKGNIRYCVFVVFCLVFAASAVSGAITLTRPTNPPVGTNIGGQVGQSLSRLTALTIVGEQIYGAGGGRLASINEAGIPGPGVAISIQDVAGLAPFREGAMVIGDCGNNSINKVNPQTGEITRLFAVRDINAGGNPVGSILSICRLSSVAFDGQNILIAVEAGYSSSIFKVNPETRQMIQHAWAPGPTPISMQFFNGSLYVFDGDSRNLRRYDERLQLNLNAVSLPVGTRGIVLTSRGALLLLPGFSRLQILQVNTEPLQTQSSAAVVAPPSRAMMIIPDHGTGGGTGVPPKPQKIAVLICGDLAESGYDEFWNDTVWMYKTLVAAGFRKDYIYVLYGNGTDYVSANPTYKCMEKVTDFAATTANVNLVLDGLKNGNATYGILKMMPIDYLYVWTFDHGSGNNPAYLCLRDGNMADTAFASKLNVIPYNIRAIFMQQCRSGGFTDNLRGGMSFVSTACRSSENAHRANTENDLYGGAYYHHGEYNYYVISAFAGKTATGATVNADSDASGKVSALEAHNWMVSHENQSEVPQMDDIGSTGRGFYLK